LKTDNVGGIAVTQYLGLNPSLVLVEDPEHAALIHGEEFEAGIVRRFRIDYASIELGRRLLGRRTARVLVHESVAEEQVVRVERCERDVHRRPITFISLR